MLFILFPIQSDSHFCPEINGVWSLADWLVKERNGERPPNRSTEHY